MPSPWELPITLKSDENYWVIPAPANQMRKSRADLQCIYMGYILIPGEILMSKARVFKSGNSQAVRLPKEFRFDVKEVEIFRRGDEIVLREPRRNLARAFELLTSMPEDFFADGRKDDPPQEREDL